MAFSFLYIKPVIAIILPVFFAIFFIAVKLSKIKSFFNTRSSGG